MDVFIIPLLVVLLYLGGSAIDRQAQHNYFIGGLLPFIGFKTQVYGPMQLKAFWVAWFWKGVMCRGVVSRRDQ